MSDLFRLSVQTFTYISYLPQECASAHLILCSPCLVGTHYVAAYVQLPWPPVPLANQVHVFFTARSFETP
jgi:hypothetical protein